MEEISRKVMNGLLDIQTIKKQKYFFMKLLVTNRKIRLNIFLTVLLLVGLQFSNAQDPGHLEEEVDKLYNKKYNFNNDKRLIVFAGSSSLRLWKDLQDYYPRFNIINNGFGGSQFSDLIYFYNKIITNQKPDYLFIYEGDNDIAENKKVHRVYRDFKKLFKKLKMDLPDTKVIFISVKPSIARWNLKNDYNKLNKKMSRYCRKKNDNIEFADVWSVMLDNLGNLRQNIFIEDGLHMNKKGYDLWNKVLSSYLQ